MVTLLTYVAGKERAQAILGSLRKLALTSALTAGIFLTAPPAHASVRLGIVAANSDRIASLDCRK
jgi:hypothetical protein